MTGGEFRLGVATYGRPRRRNVPNPSPTSPWPDPPIIGPHGPRTTSSQETR